MEGVLASGAAALLADGLGPFRRRGGCGRRGLGLLAIKKLFNTFIGANPAVSRRSNVSASAPNSTGGLASAAFSATFPAVGFLNALASAARLPM